MIVNYRKMYPFTKPYLFRAVLSLLLAVPVGLMDAAIAWLLKPYMDVVMIGKDSTWGLWIPIIIVLFSLTQSSFNYASTYLNEWVGLKITIDVKRKLFAKLMRSEANFFDNNSSGDILLQFNNNVETACTGLLSNLKLLVVRVCSSISLIAVLFYNSWQLAIVAVLILALALYPLTQIRRRIKSIFQESLASIGKLMTYYNEASAGNRIISANNLYDQQNSKFGEATHKIFRTGMRIVQRTGSLTPIMHFIVSIGIALVIWLGSYLIVNNELTPGGFVSFITALILLYTPIKSMGNTFGKIQLSFIAMDMIFGNMERKPAVSDKDDAIELKPIKQGINFNNVSFHYNPEVPVLKNVNLHIDMGKVYAFVGNSGGGKTTLVNLIPRFYDVCEGSITIDEVDLRDLKIDSLRENISIVFQDNFLFSGTIRENIVLDKIDTPDHVLDQVLKNSYLTEFVNSLPNGVNTEIGERGVFLSGGQKQRLAIARAFIKNSPIVILDEATSALDNKSEAIVQEAITNLMQNRTVLIIAHRLSTIVNADKIVVINNGELAEQGSHAELLACENSIYKSLYRSQFKDK